MKWLPKEKIPYLAPGREYIVDYTQNLREPYFSRCVVVLDEILESEYKGGYLVVQVLGQENPNAYFTLYLNNYTDKLHEWPTGVEDFNSAIVVRWRLRYVV